MKLTKLDMVEQALVRIQMFQEHVSNIDRAASCLCNCDRFHGTIDYGDIRDRLVHQELDEWRNLAMWGLTLNDKERDRIKAAVHDRFLRDGMHVAQWFNGGNAVGSWLVAEEVEFRAMAKLAFAPKQTGNHETTVADSDAVLHTKSRD